MTSTIDQLWRYPAKSMLGESLSRVQAVLDGFRGPQAVRFDHIATRVAGQRQFIDLHMHMPATWTLGRAAALRFDVEQALMRAVPGLRASIQLLPMNMEAHNLDEDDLT